MKALVNIDWINEIIDEENGKLSKKGYSNFINENNVIENLNYAIKKFREKNELVIFVRLAFDKSYFEQLKDSPIFGKAHEFGILKENEWSTEIHRDIDIILDKDIVITKHRVSAFYNTKLEDILRNNQIKELFLSGVATDLAVESTARDAHDRGFLVNIISNACAAANEEDHKNSLRFLKKISKVIKVDEL